MNLKIGSVISFFVIFFVKAVAIILIGFITSSTTFSQGCMRNIPNAKFAFTQKASIFQPLRNQIFLKNGTVRAPRRRIQGVSGPAAGERMVLAQDDQPAPVKSQHLRLHGAVPADFPTSASDKISVSRKRG
jgi:hypothetical protein